MTEVVKRIRYEIKGRVQGVGFRPFLYHLSQKFHLKGFCQNISEGVLIEAQGTDENLKKFFSALGSDIPQIATIRSYDSSELPLQKEDRFEIQNSSKTNCYDGEVLPDISMCADCLNELHDPNNRRYHYPFITCTNCGPRYSIIKDLPYDRHRTTMSDFEMCLACLEEYENPDDRRFHSQTNSCFQCGPKIKYISGNDNECKAHYEAILKTVKDIRDGKIVAVKGIGGFHLICDARNEMAIKNLRKRKQRPHKPFAVMFQNFEMVAKYCEVSKAEQDLLNSIESPIVLLQQIINNQNTKISDQVNPGLKELGTFLPYSPLHQLILSEIQRPLVVTSGNLSGESICIQNEEALIELKEIADGFLLHDREILRPLDDSIMRVVLGQPQPIRIGRGYAPLVISGFQEADSFLALGGQLKNTVSFYSNKMITVSEYHGDLSHLKNQDQFQITVERFIKNQILEDQKAITDCHPDYDSSVYARKKMSSVYSVQHHVAHICSVMAEQNLQDEVLGIAWDGAGLGNDQTLWGGECFLLKNKCFKRVGHLKPFFIPGGEKALKEPRRMVFSLISQNLKEGYDEIHKLDFFNEFKEQERLVLLEMISKNINCMKTTSVGRLFDAIASLLGLCQVMTYEGQAAQLLESMTDESITDKYPFEWEKNGSQNILNYEILLRQILADIKNNEKTSVISTKFHNSMVQAILEFAKKISVENVVLSGGCFQNRYLLESTVKKLAREGFKPYWNQRVPCNDSGISLGQIFYTLGKYEFHS